MISETGPDHDFGFGAVQGERAIFDRSYGMSAAVRSPARVHHCDDGVDPDPLFLCKVSLPSTFSFDNLHCGGLL